MDWLEEVNSEEDKFEEILSFNSYMDVFEKMPQRELRTTSLYLKDMFEYYGRAERGGFELFKKEHPDSPPVAGQELAQERIYQNLVNFTEEGFNNKFILLIGPNGSSKSSLVKKIMKTAEEYSHTDHGPLYTFSWIFPIDTYLKGGLGLASKTASRGLDSYALLEDQDISAIMGSDLKDHPLLLIPIRTRQKLICKLIDDPDLLESIKRSYLYNGDLSKRNRLIFDALLKNYKGDYQEVMKHIRVERFYIDKRYSVAATTIEPQMHVDAGLQQITMDKRLASLPPGLQSLNLFSMHGEVILANRGMLEFSDLLKRPMDTFKYLLMTMETKTINLRGILSELDIFFIGSSNEVHFSAFKQHPDFGSFKGRFSFLRVPYLLDYKSEERIYLEQVSNIKDKTLFAPHALEVLCLWSVMTRMRHPQSKNYKDKKLGDIAEKMTPIEKALYLSSDILPDYLNQEEQQILKLGKREVETEFLNDTLYEGKFGISPRELKQIIYELSVEHKIVTFIEVIDYLKDLSERKNEYEFLNIGSQGDYHNPKKLLYLVEQYFLNAFDLEVRESLGLIDNRSYEEYISKYVLQVNALMKNEKIKNHVTGKYEEPDMYFIKEFENNIHLKESPESFRSHILAKLGAYALDNPGKKIIYTDVLDSISKQLKESFRNEQKKIITRVGKNLVYYMREYHKDGQEQKRQSGLGEEGRQEIEKILSCLSERYSYETKAAVNCLNFLIKKRYDLGR